MNNKISSISSFLTRAIFIAFLAFPFAAMGAGANNAKHQRHTGIHPLAVVKDFASR